MLVALGVSGGIAAYKACEIVRGLSRAGAGVQVLLTRNATRFVTPLTLATLSGREVLCDPWKAEAGGPVRHIGLTRSIDALAIAPATANVLAKFSRGIADDLLSTFYLTVTRPVVVAPAMNTRMWLHPATQSSIAALRGRGVTIIGPEHGWLAEREEGEGRMAEPEAIVRATLEAARRSERLSGCKVLVSAGPTREPLDPVRYLCNRSSGRMGFALAAAAARRGARVVLVHGPVQLAVPFGVEPVPVETAAEMREAVLRHAEDAAAVFMAAAVSDWAPEAAPSKIKRSGGPLTLRLEEGPDILAELGRRKRDRMLVGFAAETEDLEGNARAKLEAKNLDYIVANDVARDDIGFDASDNEVVILGRDGRSRVVPKASKGEIAEAVLDHVFGGAPERLSGAVTEGGGEGGDR